MLITDGLNPAQYDAVTHAEGPLLILAGPGSGKTRVIAHRIAYLISELQVPPGMVMAVTFTNKAARELRERVEKLLGEDVQHERSLCAGSECCRFVIEPQSIAASSIPVEASADKK